MSLSRDEGKDTILFVTKEEQLAAGDPLKDTEDGNDAMGEAGGAIGPDGEIDWDCPCIAGMLEPPCGDNFKAAFECFVKSTADEKGSDCIEQFRSMQECFAAHPEKYGGDDEDDEGVALTEALKEEQEAAPKDAADVDVVKTESS